MKYIKRCLALLMACVMTAVLVQPTTWAKYTTSASQNVNFTVNTNRATYTIDNILQQGNLTTLTDGEDPAGFASERFDNMGYVNWGTNLTTESVAGQGYHCLDTNPAKNFNAWYWTKCHASKGHQYYFRVNVKILTSEGDGVIAFRIQKDANTTVSQADVYAWYTDGNWKIWSGVFAPLTADAKGSQSGLRMGGGQTNSNYEYYISHMMLIDLTDTFGAGNEPPKWWCDKYIPWQDETTGTKTVQWFPKASLSALDTAFNTGSTGYYAVSNRKNSATVAANGSVSLSGSDNDVNSTSLGNPVM